jgi:hypothetical protein
MLTRRTMMSKANQIYKNVLEAMQEADEIEGVEDPQEYLNLMEAIRYEVVKRYNNCADHINWERNRNEL